MDYAELTSEAMANMRIARVRSYEEQHFTAILDQEAATAIGDDTGIKAAQERQRGLETAIAAVKGK